jgi:hypothetical protein
MIHARGEINNHWNNQEFIGILNRIIMDITQANFGIKQSIHNTIINRA